MYRSLIVKPIVATSRLAALQRVCAVNVRCMSSTNSTESYTDRQAKLGRPVSPHVTIYRSVFFFIPFSFSFSSHAHRSTTKKRFPMAAITSIMNRFTGMALTAGITGIAALSLVGADVSAIMTAVGNAPAVGVLAKFAVGFPLTYHYLGGLRHTVWDKLPENSINNESVLRSSYLLLGSATAISVVVAFVKI